MSFIDKLIGGGVAGILKGAEGIIDAVQEGKLKKAEALVQLREIADRESARTHDEIVAEIGAKERIMVAELQQGDAFTKRARPFVIYTGPFVVLLLALLYYIAFYRGQPPPPTPDFVDWYLAAWAGYGSVYSWGRTQEKRAAIAGAPVGGNGAAPSRILS